MIRVSSNLTLFLKLILPLMWLIFYGSFSVGFIFLPDERLLAIGPIWIKYVFWISFVTGSLIIYFTLLKLKRVEFGPEFIYISDFRKAYHYDYSDITDISEKNFGLFKSARITFISPTSFGDRIFFLVANKRYADFIAENPSLFSAFMPTEDPDTEE